MKREWFSRGVRMQHQFGNTEKINDPMGSGTWEPPDFPLESVKRFGSGHDSYPCEVQEKGTYSYREDPSPVQKPSGAMASLNGPAPDISEDFGRPWPVGTKRRHGPLKTDK